MSLDLLTNHLPPSLHDSFLRILRSNKEWSAEQQQLALKHARLNYYWRTLVREHGLPLLPFRDADFKRFDLSNVDFSALEFWKCDFRSADLTETNLQGARLTSADFRKARVVRTNFTGAHLYNADFRLAYMVHPDMTGANLREARMDVGAKYFKRDTERIWTTNTST